MTSSRSTLLAGLLVGLALLPDARTARAAEPARAVPAATAQLARGHVEDAPGAVLEPRPPAPKAEAKAPGPPELPNLAHVIYTVWPESTVGKFMHQLNWMRPIFALTVVLLVLIVMVQLSLRRSLIPGRLQTAVEMIVEALDGLICGTLGKENGRKFLPYLGSLFLYILCLNLFGLFPLMMSPTSFIATTAAFALCTFVVVQITAFSKLGFFGVLYHWAGEPKDGIGWGAAVMLFPLHILEEFIKPISLSLRLFGNIFGEDVLLGAMLMLGIMITSFLPAAGVPLGFPLHLPFMFLALLTSTIQALVFTLLSTIYISLVLPHHDHEEHGHETTAETAHHA
jgi:F-type H+-transporting ATPase subunit a